jgi:hypothetical protein
MIKTEFLNDGKLIKHYSDSGVMLLQVETNMMYADPIDVVPCRYTYTETDVPIYDGNEETDGEMIIGDGISGEEFLDMIQEVL